jgi:cystathionine gamma-synthase
MRIETEAIHLGHEIDPGTGAISPPIYLSTTYERDPDGGYPKGYVYTRLDNPNRQSLEKAVAGLEKGGPAAAFSSGLAAIMAVLQALATGDHVVASQDLYHGTTRILKELFGPWGLQATFVDTTDPGQVAGALQPNTKLIFLETPSNPTLKITDIRETVAIARKAGARTVFDNTWATPVLQRPLELGADLVVHSTTKYFGGHSDVLGGIVVGRQDDEFFQRLRFIQQIGGAVPSPFDCWLVLRGLQTLPYRIKNHNDNCQQVADFLVNHPQVQRVYYPGLADHPGHAVAAGQMNGYGGMLSFQVQGDRQAALAVTAKVLVIKRATSLGGVESLIEHRASIEGPASKTPDNLLRLSVGLENAADLIDDLDNALK